ENLNDKKEPHSSQEGTVPCAHQQSSAFFATTEGDCRLFQQAARPRPGRPVPSWPRRSAPRGAILSSVVALPASTGPFPYFLAASLLVFTPKVLHSTAKGRGSAAW